MKKQWRWFMRCIAMTLTLALLICQIPVGAIAVSDESETIQTTAPQDVNEATVVAEDVSKREESVKHFRMSDGTYRAVQYDIPVHFMQDGQWVDYDNTLTEVNSEENTAEYANTTADYEVRLSKKTNGKKWVRLEKDGYKISWYYTDAAKSTGVTTETKDDGDPTTLENAVSTVTYADIYENIDLRYRVSPTGIKEDLILKKSGTQTAFVAEYNIDTLTAVQTDAQTIELRDADGAVVYTLSAPYMTDAAGAVSTAMTYRIVSTKNKRITVELTADKEWLNAKDRKYPVTVDPDVTLQGTAVQTTYINKNNKDTVYANETRIIVGTEYASGLSRGLVKLSALPQIDDCDVIVAADITAYVLLSSTDMHITAHPVTSAWSVNTVNWNTGVSYKPAVDAADVSSFQAEWPAEQHWCTWDITSIVRGWYADGNTGLMFRSSQESDDVLAYAMLVTERNGIHPYITIDYRSGVGLEDYWTYIGAEAGRSGSIAVNVFNGNAVATQPVTLSAGGNRLPVQISLTYNANQTKHDLSFGKGWQSNYQQSVVPHDTLTGYYYYTDGDGTRHAFRIAEGDTDYTDEDGLGYTLTVEEDAYTITDRDDNQMIFNADGNLTTIKDTSNNTITVTYDSNDRMTLIKDGAGRSYTLTYTGEHITKISDPAGRETILSYNGDLLTSITFSDGKTITYTYTGGRLTSILGNDGCTTAISYTAEHRAASLERRVDTTVESKVTLDYGVNETRVTSEKNEEEKQDNTIVYQFDYYGQTTAVVSYEENAGLFYQYEDRVDSPLKAFKLSVESGLQVPVINLLPNSGFDTSASPFYTLGSGNSTRSFAWDSTKGHTANGSLKVTRTGTPSASNDYAFYAYYFTVPKEGYYTLSGYANTNGETITSHGAEIRLERWTSGHGSSLGGKGVSINKTAVNEWKYGSTTMYFEEGDTIKALVGIEDAIGVGTAWFDDLQLEYSAVANKRNLLQNTDFENGTFGWTKQGVGSVTTATDEHAPAAKAMTVTGEVAMYNWMTQTVKVKNGQAGDTYSVGAWARANSIATELKKSTIDVATTFGIQVEFRQGNFVVNSQYIPFNRYINSWQMMSAGAVALGAYDSVRVRLDYSYNLNTAQFTLPYLYRENYGQSYEYDDNGQLIGSVNTDDTESEYEYDNDYQLIRQLNPSGREYLYNYNDKNQLIGAMLEDGTQYEMEYDRFGNNTASFVSESKAVDGGRYYLVNAASNQAATTYLETIVTFSELDLMQPDQLWRIMLQEDDVYRIYGYREEIYQEAFTLNPNGNHFHTVYIEENESTLYKFVKQNDGTYVILTGASDYTKCITAVPFGVDGVVPADEIVMGTSTYDEDNVTDNQKWYLRNANISQVAYIATRANYTADGNFLSVSRDALDNRTQYFYNEDTGHLESVTDANGNVTTYAYLENSNMPYAITAGGQTLYYTYDAADRVSIITTPNGENYRFVYDMFGRNTAIEIVGETDSDTVTLCQWVYDDDGLLEGQRYNDGTTYEYGYDGLSRPVTVYRDGQLQQVYYYNARGDIAAVADIPEKKAVRYVFDEAGRVSEELTFVYSGTVTDENELIEQLLILTNYKYRTTYTYDDTTGYVTDESLTTPIGSTEVQYTYGNVELGQNPDAIYAVSNENSLMSGKDHTVTYTYDSLGRAESRTVKVWKPYENVYTTKTTTYTYKTGGYGTNSTSTQIASITTDGVTYTYNYDALGNITQIKKNGAVVENYEYDALSQLTKVIKADGTYYEYIYNNNGNLTTVKKNGSTVHTYTYDSNGTWKDQLTAFNGNAITYDANGNPLTYHDGAVMTWANGRNLTSYVKGDTTVNFTYASDNTRTTKTVNGVTTTYYYVGGRLYGEMTGNNKLIYLYDASGTPYGYVYNDSPYYYERNVQGDVVSIFNYNGIRIANYTYDAWGNITSIKNQYGEDVTNQPRHQGNLNPIRYRGYHYDAELDMYWLTTRFYDPAIGRFINADTQLNDGMLGNNLYAYCSNDPINLCDCTGNCAHNLMVDFCSSCSEAKERKDGVEVSFYEISFDGYSIINAIWYNEETTEFEITTIFIESNDAFPDEIIAFNYQISSKGVIRFRFHHMTDTQKKNLKKYYPALGEAMLNAGLSINSDFLKGRSGRGLAKELKAHYNWYVVLSIQRLNTADMGSSVKGASGYDSNAYLFE